VATDPVSLIVILQQSRLKLRVVRSPVSKTESLVLIARNGPRFAEIRDSQGEDLICAAGSGGDLKRWILNKTLGWIEM